MRPPEPVNGAPASLQTLRDELQPEVLRHSHRILILLAMGVNRRLGFTELMRLTRLGKGSLSHHLDQLARAGLIRSQNVFTIAGPRVMVEITPSGDESFQRLTTTLADLARHRTGGP
jgi:DNA-binding HxlR family transcriptional regulator